MENPNNIHLLYKKLGETPLECLERFKSENPDYQNVPMTYAGRLDPMAEGLLLALSGEAVHEKEKYLGLSKTYVCQVLWGVETDSLDILGLVSGESSIVPLQKHVETEIVNMVGTFEQQYPVYSSRPVNGKPLFQWAREGKLGEIEIPSHEVELLSAEFISRRKISARDLLSEILQKVDLVSGDFRQEEIKAKWREVLISHSQKEFVIDTLRFQCSSGFYVRQFVADLTQKFVTRAITFHILREQVGKYTL